MHLKQSVIIVHTFWDANVNMCYIWLIASHLKCDVIVCYVWLGWLYLIWSVMWLCVTFSWVHCISSEMWCDQLIEDANAMAAKRDSVFHLKCKRTQEIQMHVPNIPFDLWLPIIRLPQLFNLVPTIFFFE